MIFCSEPGAIFDERSVTDYPTVFVWLNREKVEHRRGEPTTGWYETVCSHGFETTNNFGQSSIFSLTHPTKSTTLPVEKFDG